MAHLAGALEAPATQQPIGPLGPSTSNFILLLSPTHSNQQSDMTFLICPRWRKSHPPSPSTFARYDHDGPLEVQGEREEHRQNLGMYEEVWS